MDRSVGFGGGGGSGGGSPPGFAAENDGAAIGPRTGEGPPLHAVPDIQGGPQGGFLLFLEAREAEAEDHLRPPLEGMGRDAPHLQEVELGQFLDPHPGEALAPVEDGGGGGDADARVQAQDAVHPQGQAAHADVHQGPRHAQARDARILQDHVGAFPGAEGVALVGAPVGQGHEPGHQERVLEVALPAPVRDEALEALLPGRAQEVEHGPHHELVGQGPHQLEDHVALLPGQVLHRGEVRQGVGPLHLDGELHRRVEELLEYPLEDRGILDAAFVVLGLSRLRFRHASRLMGLRPFTLLQKPRPGKGHFQTLKRKCITSPSLTTYSLPSDRMRPASLAPCSPFRAMKSS